MQNSWRQIRGWWLVGLVTAMVATTAGVGWWRPVELSGIQPRRTNTRISLNRADADALCLLPGIGPRLAGRIVLWRERHGLFSRVDEIQKVSGIGPVLCERIRPIVVCAIAPPVGLEPPLDAQ